MARPTPLRIKGEQTAHLLPRAVVIGFCALILVASATLLAITLYQKWHQALEEACKTTVNLVRTLEEQAVRSIRETDRLLSDLAYLFEEQSRGGTLLPEQVERALAAHAQPGMQYRNLAVTDASGMRIASAAESQPPRDLSGRDYFIALRDHPEIEFYISKPFFSRADKIWSLGFSRRLHREDGSFGGIVFAAIDLERLQRFYASLDVGTNGKITLWDGAATVLARYPVDATPIGHSVPAGPLVDRVLSAQNEGSFQSVSPLDGVERIVSFRRIAEFPLVVSVALATGDVLANWYKDLWRYGIGAIVIWSTVVSLTIILLRQFAQRDRLVAALRGSEASSAQAARRLVDAIESLSAGFAIFDADDRFVMGNRVFIRLVHGPGGDKLGQTFAELVEDFARRFLHPDAIGTDREAWLRERMEQHRQPSGPVELRLRDGRWSRIDETRTSDGGTVLIHTDITELKQAELALRVSEERFRDFAETASDWYWETDSDHRFSYISDRVRAFDLDRNKLLGTRLIDTTVDQFDDQGQWREHLARIDRHEPFSDFIYRYTVDGEDRYRCPSGKPLFDDKGNFLGYRGTTRDVTEMIRSQERLRNALTTAEMASRAKSAFLASMSHELRTPLNAIIGFSDIIRTGIPGTDAEKTRDYASDIYSSGQHLLKLISDILEVSRIEAGKLDLRKEELAIAEVIAGCVRLVSHRATEAGVQLTVAGAAESPRLFADETRVKQILLNLLSNALKFTAPGGHVTIGAAIAPDGAVTITVTDTGIGMTPDDIAIAMQPFGQVDSSLARRFEGTGLGLPLTKALVELHGGRLTIDSVPRVGTTATVIFPNERLPDEQILSKVA
jgi:PAS domain S-box-containing protein